MSQLRDFEKVLIKLKSSKIEVGRAGDGELVCPECLIAASSLRKKPSSRKKVGMSEMEQSRVEKHDTPEELDLLASAPNQSGLATDLSNDITGISLFTVQVTSPALEYYVVPKAGLQKFFHGNIRENLKQRFFNNLAHRTQIIKGTENWDYDPRVSDYFYHNKHQITKMEPLQNILYKESFPAPEFSQADAESLELVKKQIPIKRSKPLIAGKVSKFNPSRVCEILNFGGATHRPPYNIDFEYIRSAITQPKKRIKVVSKTDRKLAKKLSLVDEATTKLSSSVGKPGMTSPITEPQTSRESIIPKIYNFVYSIEKQRIGTPKVPDNIQRASLPCASRPLTTGLSKERTDDSILGVLRSPSKTSRKFDPVTCDNSDLATWFKSRQSPNASNSAQSTRIYLPSRPTTKTQARSGSNHKSTAEPLVNSTDIPLKHDSHSPLPTEQPSSTNRPVAQFLKRLVHYRIISEDLYPTNLLTAADDERSSSLDAVIASQQQRHNKLKSLLLNSSRYEDSSGVCMRLNSTDIDRSRRTHSLDPVASTAVEDSLALISTDKTLLKPADVRLCTNKQASEVEHSKAKLGGFCTALKTKVAHNQQSLIADRIKLCERSIFCPMKTPNSTRKLLRVMKRAKQVGLKPDEIAQVIQNSAV
jgi:hypothetical protein